MLMEPYPAASKFPGNLSLWMPPRSPLCLALRSMQLGLTASQSFPPSRPLWVSARVSDLLVMSLMKK